MSCQNLLRILNIGTRRADGNDRIDQTDYRVTDYHPQLKDQYELRKVDVTKTHEIKGNKQPGKLRKRYTGIRDKPAQVRQFHDLLLRIRCRCKVRMHTLGNLLLPFLKASSKKTAQQVFDLNRHPHQRVHRSFLTGSDLLRHQQIVNGQRQQKNKNDQKTHPVAI